MSRPCVSILNFELVVHLPAQASGPSPFPPWESSGIARASRLLPRQMAQRVTQPDETDESESSILSCGLNKLTRRLKVTHWRNPKTFVSLTPVQKRHAARERRPIMDASNWPWNERHWG